MSEDVRQANSFADAPAIRVKEVSKCYRLYDRGADRLRDALGFGGKKRFREHHALDRLSFDVQRGETVGIIGTNGAGKSTILKIITGVLHPTAGEVEIRGRISALLELGAGFNMEYTGLENVYMNGTMSGLSRAQIDEKLDQILRFADIGEYIHQPVKSYSSGMFVRLAFAVAVHVDPDILIVDEALSVGDAFFQAKCYKKFEDFKASGKTVVFVSHDLSSITQFCDRVILLDHGKKEAEGAAPAMVDLYKKLLVQKEREPLPEEGAPDGAISGAGKKQEDVTPAAGPDLPGASPAVGGSGQGLAPASERPWREYMNRNPEASEYGDRRAEILDFGIFDEQGLPTGTIRKGTCFSIRMRVQAHEEIAFPICAYTIRNTKGTDVTGTNTWFEKCAFTCAAGEEKLVTFTQKMNLQGGSYLLSLGFTGYGENEEFEVYHRLYEVCSLEVVSDKNTVGYYDMDSEISVTDIPKKTAGEAGV